MVRAEQLNLLAFSPEAARLARLRALRDSLPTRIRFGTVDWHHPQWGQSVFADSTTGKELELHGLGEYVEHYRFSTVCFASGAEPFTAGILRRYAAQLPDGFTFFVDAHRCVTAPRLTRGAGFDVVHSKVNPNFLDAHYFDLEVWRPLLHGFDSAALRDNLGAVLLSFPHGLHAAGIHPEAFAERLENFFVAAPEGVPFAVELREPEYLTLDYARVLACHGATHIFTTAPGMPTYAEQQKWVPSGRHLLVRMTEPVGTQYPSDSQRRHAVADLIAAAGQHEVHVLVDDAAEGGALQTIDRLIELTVAGLDAKEPDDSEN